MSKKPRFRTPCDSQHVKESETLLKISLPHFHHIVFITLAKIQREKVYPSDI